MEPAEILGERRERNAGLTAAFFSLGSPKLRLEVLFPKNDAGISMHGRES